MPETNTSKQSDLDLIAFLEKEKSDLCIQHAEEIKNLKKEYEVRSTNDSSRVVQEVERERNEQIQILSDQIATLTQTIADKDAIINSVNETLTEYGAEIVRLRQDIANKDELINSLNETLIKYTATIVRLNSVIAEQNAITQG